jgi:integral membrane protein
VRNLFNAYRILAPIVGVLLTVMSAVALPMKYLLTEGSSGQKFGEDISIGWVFHGWFYIAYVIVAFLIARRARWSVQFSVLVLLAGLIPLLIFYVERVVVRKLREQFPELNEPAASAPA